ncbi:MAG TPA: glycyl-radical enzyme activating protein [Actinomycetota bacterium]|nr:glycyl-radical enzyme activating protein [Actinomycetota bacterium]
MFATLTRPAPLLLEVKGNALDDGPGIRSVIFFKGCPLSCVWCHNPESQRRTAELSFDVGTCVAGCTRCLDACPHDAITPGVGIDRTACTLCFDCVPVCPSGALRQVGEPANIAELMEGLRADKPFFEASGGGVTFSGGEATLAMGFLGELAAACHAEGIHTLLETAGHFRWKPFQRDVLPHLDTIYYDLKLFDSAAHRKYCGRPNDQILANFARLVELAGPQTFELQPRIPLIPGITATEENVTAIGRFLLDLGVRQVRLLDYNPTWVDKCAQLGITSEFVDSDAMRTWLPRGVAAGLRQHLTDLGLEAT